MGHTDALGCAECCRSLDIISDSSIKFGIGWADTIDAVFYGRSHHCKDGKPLLRSLIQHGSFPDTETNRICKEAMELLAAGAAPEDDYGYTLYSCPECKSLNDRFYFRLITQGKAYEPDYQCLKCKIKISPLILEPMPNGERCIYQAVYKNDKSIVWSCPICGGTNIKRKKFMDWD